MPHRPTFIAIASGLLASAGAAQNQVWSVDDDGPADFKSLQAAIEFAAPGDALLISGGAYTAGSIAGKPLTLIGADDEVVVLEVPAQSIVDFQPGLFVYDLAPDSPVALVGLNVDVVFANGSPFGTGSLSGTGSAVAGAELQSPLWIQSCELRSGGGLDLKRASAVVRDSVVEGTETGAWGSSEVFFNGARLAESDLLAYGSSFTGALGLAPGCIIGFSCGDPGTGGNALRIGPLSTAYLAGVTLTGGSGESSICNPGISWSTPGLAADGIHTSVGSYVATVETTIAPGVNGDSNSNCSPLPNPVAPIVGGGIVDQLPDSRRELIVDDVVYAGDVVAMTVTGLPGEAVYLAIATTPAEAHSPFVDGQLIVGADPRVIHLGTIDGSGALTVATPTPALPPGAEYLALYLQPVLAAPGAVGVAGEPAAIVVLDPSL